MDEAAAERLLWPSAEAIVEAWRIIVRAEREQTEQLPDRPRPEDYYAPVAQSFRGDPGREDDPVLGELMALVQPHEVWIDVGAGGGRYTLPIARKAAQVIAVEPSEGMRRVLTAAIADYGITNVEILAERWPAPSAAPKADVSFISHVGYDIEEIGGFLAQMEAHAGRLCVAVMFQDAPMTYFAPLWQVIHGERRFLLPGLGQFAALLFARGRTPEIRLLSLGPRAYQDIEALQMASRRPLWVRPDSPLDAKLTDAIRRIAVPVAGGVALSAAARTVAVVTWKPGV